MTDEKDKSLSVIKDGGIDDGDAKWGFDVGTFSPNEEVFPTHKLIGLGYDEMWVNEEHRRYVVIKGSRACPPI